MPRYLNTQSYDLNLVGPDGDNITIRRNKEVVLPDFFDRFADKGILKKLDGGSKTPQATAQPIAEEQRRTIKQAKQSKSSTVIQRAKQARQSRRSTSTRSARSTQKIIKQEKKPSAAQAAAMAKQEESKKKREEARAQRKAERDAKRQAASRSAALQNARNRANRASQQARAGTGQKLGRGFYKNATEDMHRILESERYPISNGIGVGILSYNRPDSLRRLINSIKSFTDLTKTTVFISDDNSDDPNLLRYLRQLQSTGDFVVMLNQERLGVAGNSNRLLRCLKRFPNKLLLNDDVEVKAAGWDSFYARAMNRSKMHHFCHRQPGVYGAKDGTLCRMGSINLKKVDDKPHGAIMALDHEAFETVGYFDEAFGYYGMEHVDWSTRLSDSRIQAAGFYDVDQSSKFFTVHSDRSAVPERVKHFRTAREKYAQMVKSRPIYIEPTDKSAVKCIGYVIPFREVGDRRRSIVSVINNIRAQKFPEIDIVLSEHCHENKLSDNDMYPLKHVRIDSAPNGPFNKSKIFNAGVALLDADAVVLHDADTMAPGSYTNKVYRVLQEYESCHLCTRVYYANGQSTLNINKSGKVVAEDLTCDRYVGYFEGGSLACTVDAYWRIGGFYEAYEGYGCEDCDFYLRLSKNTQWLEDRTVNLLHLHHGRSGKWRDYHKLNKALESKLARLTMSERIKKARNALKSGPHARFIK